MAPSLLFVAMMQRLGLDAAFAFDAHFEQYGQFVRLPLV
jgi:hypothetical protein